MFSKVCQRVRLTTTLPEGGTSQCLSSFLISNLNWRQNNSPFGPVSSQWIQLPMRAERNEKQVQPALRAAAGPPRKVQERDYPIKYTHKPTPARTVTVTVWLTPRSSDRFNAGPHRLFFTRSDQSLCLWRRRDGSFLYTQSVAANQTGSLCVMQHWPGCGTQRVGTLSGTKYSGNFQYDSWSEGWKPNPSSLSTPVVGNHTHTCLCMWVHVVGALSFHQWIFVHTLTKLSVISATFTLKSPFPHTAHIWWAHCCI